MSKIICVGLARTGTTSLYEALCAMGVNAAPTSAPLLDNPNAKILDRYDAFADNPIPFIYPDLDERFPGSKFVWTRRDLQSWLTSMQWLFEVGVPRLGLRERRLGRRVHRELYGIDVFDAQVLAEVHRTHEARTAQYFSDRPEDVLELQLEDGLDWQPLAGFLGLVPPDRPFPSVNAATRRATE